MEPENGGQLGGSCSTISVRSEMARTEVGVGGGQNRSETWSVKGGDNGG